jgi:hypothetical protein
MTNKRTRTALTVLTPTGRSIGGGHLLRMIHEESHALEMLHEFHHRSLQMNKSQNIPRSFECGPLTIDQLERGREILLHSVHHKPLVMAVTDIRPNAGPISLNVGGIDYAKLEMYLMADMVRQQDAKIAKHLYPVKPSDLEYPELSLEQVAIIRKVRYGKD